MTFQIQSRLVALVTLLLSASIVMCQATAVGGAKSGVDQRGFTWTEAYEGSGNSDGFITDLNSTVGYVFGAHFTMSMSVPYFFIQPASAKTGSTSATGMGNPSMGLKYSTKGRGLDFSTSLGGAIPTASFAKGLSTGHVTVDWTNHLAHEFDAFTPFVDFGLGNSIPDSRFLHRPYISYGDVSHYEGGTEIDLGDRFSVTASGYYILPWGPQQVFVRGTKSSSVPMKGGVSLTRDNGINFGVDYSLTRSFDLGAGYSRSVYSALNTFSFGIEMNLGTLLRKPSRP